MTARIFDLFDAMPAEARMAVAQAAGVRHFPSGSTIYQQGDVGDAMFRLVRGEVRLSFARPDGRELYYVMMGPGDCFGESNHVDGLSRPQTAEAKSDVEVQVLAGAAIERLCVAYPSVRLAIMKLLANHMRLLIDLLADASLNDLEERVARRIVNAVPPQADRGACQNLPVHLSQSEIAHMVGASRQSVNKVLQRFQDEHLITTEYGGLTIESFERLRERAFPCTLSTL